MRSTEMQKTRARGARRPRSLTRSEEAHRRRYADDACRRTRSHRAGDQLRPMEIRTTLRTVVEHLRSPKVEACPVAGVGRLEIAASSESTK